MSAANTDHTNSFPFDGVQNGKDLPPTRNNEKQQKALLTK